VTLAIRPDIRPDIRLVAPDIKPDIESDIRPVALDIRPDIDPWHLKSRLISSLSS